MGEYAKYDGLPIKIGTMEEMYYLRADQRSKVVAQFGNVDPVSDVAELRFRFPWPDEDDVKPGAFDQYNRSLALNIKPPDGVEHHDIQFVSHNGLLVSLPCPNNGEPSSIVRNGYAGDFTFGQQKFFGGHWILIGECGACGAKFRIETLEEAMPIVAEVLREGKAKATRDNGGQITDKIDPFYAEVAARILAGYKEGA